MKRNEQTAIERIRNDILSIFDRWRPRRSEGEEFWSPATAIFGESLPSIEMEEDEKEVRVTAEMPGLSTDDFKVELTGNRLSIRGEKKESHEEKGREYFYSERSYGSFSRAIILPCEVDEKKVEAEYKDGVLKMRLPKTEASKAKQIQVKVS